MIIGHNTRVTGLPSDKKILTPEAEPLIRQHTVENSRILPGTLSPIDES